MDLEDIADSFLRRVRLDFGEAVHLGALARAHGLTIVPSAPRGCRGMTLPGVLFTDGSREGLAHELAHVAMDQYGIPRPHHEPSVIAVAARLVSPRDAVRRATRCGASYMDLAKSFGVRGTCAILRVGEVTREPIAIVTPTRVYARGDWEWPAEDVLRRMLATRSRLIRRERMQDDPRRTILRPSESPIVSLP